MTQHGPFELTYTCNGEKQTKEFDQEKVVMGRASTCDVVISDEVEVSRQHASIEYRDGDWVVSDLGSRNKTFVNQREVKSARLNDQDVINLGPVQLTFRLPKSSGPSSDEIVVFDDQPSVRPNVTSVINMEEINKVLGGGLRTGSSSELISATLGDVKGGSLSLEEAREMQGAGWVINLFNQASEALLTTDDLTEMLDKVLEMVFNNLPVQRGVICLLEENGDPTPRATRTVNEQQNENIRISRSIANQVIRSKEALLVADAMSDDQWRDAQSIASMQIRSAMCTPLYREGRVIGFIYVDTQIAQQPFIQQHLEVLTTLAVLSAVGIEQASLRDSVRREQKIRERLGRYSSPAIVKQIVSGAGNLEEGMMSEERMVTVLFCDLCGFTSMSERMKPPEVVQVLNTIFERMTDAIFKYDGTLDKYMGDALMALFGAPLKQEDHAERAVWAALEMLKELETFNELNSGRDPISMRIGINSGRCVAGDIGSPKRKDYTVIGDSVNVASRLESSVAKPGQIVIGPMTYELVRRNFRCEPLPKTVVKGRREEVQPYVVCEPITGSSIHSRRTEEIYGNG